MHDEGVYHAESRRIGDRMTQTPEEDTAMISIISFSDELAKIAFRIPGGILGRAGGMPRGLKVGLAAGAGAGLYSHGKGKGRKQGYSQGTAQTRTVAERAYKIGVTRGAVAMRSHILERMKASMGTSQGK